MALMAPLDLLLDNKQSETRRMQKKKNINAERSEAGNKGPKIHYLGIKGFFFTKKCQEVHKR